MRLVDKLAAEYAKYTYCNVTTEVEAPGYRYSIGLAELDYKMTRSTSVRLIPIRVDQMAPRRVRSGVNALLARSTPSNSPFSAFAYISPTSSMAHFAAQVSNV